MDVYLRSVKYFHSYVFLYLLLSDLIFVGNLNMIKFLVIFIIIIIKTCILLRFS